MPRPASVGRGPYLLLLVLTLPLPPESLPMSCLEDEEGKETNEDCGDQTPKQKQVGVWSLDNEANLWRRERAGFGPLLSLGQ